MILVGTADGFVPLGSPEMREPRGHAMEAAAVWQGDVWAVSDGSTLWHHRRDGDGEPVAQVAARRVNCVAARGTGVWVGASEATLYRFRDGSLVRDDRFDAAPGRQTWHTPWGGPPDVRSLSIGPEGRLYVNVHVGGVLIDDGDAWRPTMDIGADVHEVRAHPDDAGVAYAASARGLGFTTDGGESWEFHSAGLHGAYCRAVAVAGDRLLLSASLGSSGHRAAVYRAPADLSSPFARCEAGLPEWFTDNIDTHCLALDDAGYIASADGEVYRSEDLESWDRVADGLGPTHCLVVV